MKCMSFDGDADRQVYFYGTEDGKMEVIDGDKQFAFIIMYIKNLLKKLDVEDKLSLALVQTAYQNSRVAKYLQGQGVKNIIVKTGVKNAHPVVMTLDIGANDEPNGHGTVAYKADRVNEVLGDNQSIDAKKLKALLAISNIVVGDSIANLLVLEAILYDLDMSIQDLSQIYQENPSRMYKAKVSDRTKFKPNGDESRLVEPAELQAAIDKAVSEVEEGKAFVRPSGTEDILRLYAEAKTLEQTESLGNKILAIIET